MLAAEMGERKSGQYALRWVDTSLGSNHETNCRGRPCEFRRAAEWFMTPNTSWTAKATKRVEY